MGHTELKKSNLAQWAGWLLVIGIIILFGIPLLLSIPAIRGYLNYLTTIGQIGDIIGGSTAPFLSLIGSCLVYFALKSQVQANELLQGEINEGKAERRLAEEAENLNNIYLYLEENINSFTFKSFPEEYIDPGEITTDEEFKGGSAFKHFFLQIRCHYHGDQEYVDEHQAVAEVMSILTLMDLLLKKLLECKCSNREMLLTLTKHLFLYKISTDFNKLDPKDLDLTYCSGCKIDHGLPVKMKDLILEIRKKLSHVA